MKTQHRLALTLKTLMSEMPLDQISVLLLTKKCKVKRQTFYYYFHDIYDLLTQVFLDETIPEVETANDLTSLLTVIYRYYEANKTFLDAVLSSGGKDLFQEFLYNTFYQSTLKFISKDEASKNVKPNDRKLIARFYASAYSNSFMYYLINFNHKSLKGALACFAFVNQNAINDSIKFYVNEQQTINRR